MISLSAVVSGVAYLGLFSLGSILALLYFFQKRLIYPSDMPPGSRDDVATPPRVGVEHWEDITLTTPDGIELKAYLLKQRTPELTKEAWTVLYCHANAGNMGHRLGIAKVLNKQMGLNVFMLSYRGYGKSQGKPDEVGIKIDAETALEYLRNHPLVDRDKLIVYGQSLGGAVAIDLAAKSPGKIKAIVVENTFTSLPDVVPSVFPLLKPLTVFCHQKWRSIDQVTKIRVPALFMSGAKDELIPPSMMRQLFDATPSAEKRIVSFQQGTHNDTCLDPTYFMEFDRFVRDHVKSGKKDA